MIQVTIYRNRAGRYLGFSCRGHAGFADAGEDVVCAGVSALVINTANSIAMFTGEECSADSDEETGELAVSFGQPAGHDAELLMNALILGLRGIRDRYGADYMDLNFKEV